MFKTSELPFRRRTWTDLAAIPMNRRGWELSDCDDVPEDVVKTIESWLKAVLEGKIIRAEGSKACGKGLLLYGSSGHGKSTLALAAVQYMLRNFTLDTFVVRPNEALTRPAYFIQYTDLVSLRGALMDDPTIDQVRLFEGIMGECKEDNYNIRVLVIDDVGREHKGTTEWSKNLLHQILRSRYSKGLPTIITSNTRLDEWETVYGTHTASFINEAFIPIAVKSQNGDLRK